MGETDTLLEAMSDNDEFSLEEELTEGDESSLEEEPINDLSLEINTRAALANAIDPRVSKIHIYDIDGPVVLPRYPAHVTKLYLDSIELKGPVVFAEGLVSLDLGLVECEQPLGLWKLPRSLRRVYITGFTLGVIDLTQSQVKELHLEDYQGDVDQIFLPASLESVGLCTFKESSLPYLPPSVTSLVIFSCPILRDYSGARDATITHLELSRAPVRYESLPGLRTLDVHVSEISNSAILLPNLRELKIMHGTCTYYEAIEVNTPKLEKLTLQYGGRINLQGNSVDRVRQLDLMGASTFPEADEWPSLEELNINVKTKGPPMVVPYLPWVQRMSLDGLVETNRVMVANINEYKAAWGVTRRKKRAVHA